MKKEIKKLLNSIPKEHRATVNELLKMYYEMGVEDTKELLRSIVDIPANDMSDFIVTHESNLDGG